MTTTTKTTQTLRRLIGTLREAADELSDGINAGILDPVTWHNELVELLRVGYTAAYIDAAGRETLTPFEQRQIARQVAGQVEYLNGFLDQIEADGWNEGMRARVHMYTNSARQGYALGQAGGLDLPQLPGDGRTRCLTNCKCSIRVRWLDQAVGDADVYWVLGAAEHCSDCKRLARTWRPLRMRGGEVQR